MATKKRKKFRLIRKTVTLELTGDYDGGEVEIVKSTPIAFTIRILDVDTTSGAEQEALIREFGDKDLVSWNFEDADGVDIPATGDGMISLDDDIYFEVMRAWTAQLRGGRNLEQPPSEPDTSV